ncbi:uncharacterized protein trim33l [Symphorus nematophorus]
MTTVPSMETTAQRRDGVSQQCSSCDASSARCWCQDCNEALCDDCVSAHRRVTVTRSHRILNQPTAGGVSTPPIKFCRLHPSEPLKLFCFTCKQLTCRDCQLMIHMNHRYQFVDEAVETLKKQLELWAQPVRIQRDRVRQSLQDMEARLQEIVESEAQLKRELQQSLKFVTKHLEKRMEQLLKDVTCGGTVRVTGRSALTCETQREKPQSLEGGGEGEGKDKGEDEGGGREAEVTEQPHPGEGEVSGERPERRPLLDKHNHTNTAHKAATVSESEAEKIQRKMKKLKELQQNQQSVTEAAEVAKDSNDLPALLSYTAQVESQLKDLPLQVRQDLSPPQMMTEMKVMTDEKSLRALLSFVKTEWTSAQHRPDVMTIDTEVVVHWSNQLLTRCFCFQTVKHPLPSAVQTTSHQGLKSGKVLLPKNQVQPVSPSVSFGFLSSAVPSQSCTVLQFVPPSLLLNPPTAPNPKQPASVLLTNNQTVYQVSSVPRFPMRLDQTVAYSVSRNILPKQQKHCGGSTSNQLCLPPSFSCKPLPQTKTSNDVGSPDPNNHLASSWKSSSSNQLHPPPPYCSAVSDSTCYAASSQKTLSSSSQPSVSQSSCPIITNTQTVKHPLSHLKMLLSMNHIQPLSTSVAATRNQICDEPGRSAPPNREQTSNQEPLKEDSNPGAPSSPEHPVSDLTPRPSSLKQQQQSPVVRAVADSACDRSVQQVAARQQEPAENEPTSTVSEESEPAGNPAERDVEEPGSVIGHPDCLSKWQPRVSLFRLPVSLPLPGCPLPSFRLVPGDAEDEIYLEEMSDDSQSDYTDDIADDITELPSSPESPVTLQIVSCSACGSAYASIICSACGRGFHRDCHLPPVGPDIWSEWACSLCQDLSDPSDPYSSDRPQRPPSPCLSLLDQRKCESLLLYLKVEGCSRLSEVGSVWSHVKLTSERLSLRRSPSYQTVAQFLSDIWSLFKHSQDDDVLDKLQQSFQSRLMETFGPELHPPPSEKTKEGSEVADSEGGSDVTSEEQEAFTSDSKLMETRKRLKEFLGKSGSKRRRMDQSNPSGHGAAVSSFRPFLGENKHFD